MIALDAALRRLTVCQLTHESRGNGDGLRPRVWLRLRAAAGGNWTPDGTLQLEGEANFSCLGAHEALPKATLCGVVFQKLNGPLLTSGHDPRSTATSTFAQRDSLGCRRGSAFWRRWIGGAGGTWTLLAKGSVGSTVASGGTRTLRRFEKCVDAKLRMPCD